MTLFPTKVFNSIENFGGRNGSLLFFNVRRNKPHKGVRMMKIRLARYKDKPKVNWDKIRKAWNASGDGYSKGLPSPDWSTGGEWVYYAWIETGVGAWLDDGEWPIGPDEKGEDGSVRTYHPQIHVAEVAPRPIDIPNSIEECCDFINSVANFTHGGDQAGIFGGFINNLKDALLQAFALGAGDSDNPRRISTWKAIGDETFTPLFDSSTEQ